MKYLVLLTIVCFPVFAQFTTTARHITSGSSTPATCSPNSGDIFFKNTATIAVYYCSATNTWTALASGSSSGFATTALDNLASVSINTSLLAQTGVDLGSTTKPFRDLYLFGSGTYATTYLKFTGTPTSTRTITVPDATSTMVLSPTSTTTTQALFATATAGVGGYRAIATADMPATIKSWSRVVVVGDPGAASAVLANDNDTPVAVANDTGADVTITAVACWADAGSPTVTPILTAGNSTSILTGALTCGTASWAAGTVNGSPVLHTFSAGATCSSTPCSADTNITTAGGVAKYIVVKYTGTL